MSRENDRNGDILYKILAAVLIGFVTLAIAKGKTKELIFTTGILVLTWWLMSLIPEISGVFYWIPFIHYVIYWIYVLFIKKSSPHTYSTCAHWGDENWWWSLDGWQFEEEVAKVFEKNGFKTIVTRKTGDGGVDIILYKDKEKYIVQCKHYRNEVGPEPMRALWGVKEDFTADGVIMIASSGVTEASQEFISNKSQFEVLNLQDIMRLASD